MFLQCPACARLVAADKDDRFPPWCPKCGTDLKGKPQPDVPSNFAASPPMGQDNLTPSAMMTSDPPLPTYVPPESFVEPSPEKGPIPAWAWLFVVACGAIPFATLGGALPAGIGFAGAASCIAVARNRSISTLPQVAICFLITMGAWALTAIIFGGIALALLKYGAV